MRVVSGVWVVLCACYAPTPTPGSPCIDDRDCPTPLVCSPATSTCESFATASTPDAADTLIDGAPIDGPLIDGCTPALEICGNTIDEDCDGLDPACAANDVAAGAIDVTAGGMFVGDALLARDDVAANGCGADGGRDLYYQVELTAPAVYLFETFDSSFDTVIRVYGTPCEMVGTGANATTCVDDACGGTKGQVAASLPTGKSCIVIDQKSEAEVTGMLVLRVIKGGRDARPLAAGVSTNTGDTCSATSTIDGFGDCDPPGSGAKDHAYFFTTCPGQTLRLDADICPHSGWDPTLHVRRHADNTQLACNDDSCNLGPAITNVTISGGALYYLFVDGYDASECGTYSLDTNLRP